MGTTAVRALESACDANGGALAAARGWTRKFILPPYEFRAVDALLTNFHLPRTTLLLLVAAFAGEDLLRRAYAARRGRALPVLLLRGRDAGGVGGRRRVAHGLPCRVPAPAATPAGTLSSGPPPLC